MIILTFIQLIESTHRGCRGGRVFTFGNEFKLYDNPNFSDELLSINLAASFRDNENFDLPKIVF